MTTADLLECTDTVERYFRSIETELDAFRTVLRTVFTDPAGVTSDQVVAAIEARVRTYIGTSPVVGAGFVASVDALRDRARYLAWWKGDGHRPIAETGSAHGIDFDYTRNEWFREPMQTGRSHVTGPYIDVVCIDDFVVTSTLPVVVDGRATGVVGADTLVETLEDLFLDPLDRAGATLVNLHGRVVVSADPHVATGDHVDVGVATPQRRCDGLPLVVAVLGR